MDKRVTGECKRILDSTVPDETEHDPDSKVYHRIWDAEAKVWRHELANYQLS